MAYADGAEIEDLQERFTVAVDIGHVDGLGVGVSLDQRDFARGVLALFHRGDDLIDQEVEQVVRALVVSLSFGYDPVRQPNSQYHLIDHIFSSKPIVTEIPLRSKAHNKREHFHNASLSIMHYYRRKINVCNATPSNTPLSWFSLILQRKRIISTLRSKH